MAHFLFSWSIFLAQTTSSDTGDFLRQISGLVVITCAAGLVWVVLMVVIFQRGAERRRRVQRGQEPLPPLHVSAYRWAQRLTGSGPRQTPFQPPPAPAPSTPDAMPAPDLSMLTGDLPEPDLADMVGTAADDAAAYDADDLAREFTLEPEPAAAIPGEDHDAENVMPVDAPDEDADRDDAAVDADGDDADDAGSAEYEDYEADDVPPQPAPGDAVELLRVWRDLSDGALILEVGGRRFRTLAELGGTELERRFLTVVRDLSAMVETTGRPAAAPQPAAPKTPPSPADDPGEPGAHKRPPTEEIDMASLSMGPGSMFRQMTRVAMGQAPEPTESQPILSLAEQIETRLQDRLDALPEFEGRKIHVRPALDGGVRIEVDGTFYDGVSEIEDDDVRDLIADVVREWSDTQ